MALALISCAVMAVIVCWLYFKPRKTYRLPPGPKTVPIFGNALQFDFKRFPTQLADLGKEYAEAYTVKLFTEDIVVLNSFDLIQEAMVSSEYANIVSGRPPTFLREHFLRNDAMLRTYSDEWVTLRKIVFRGMKMYGSNLKDVEDLVQEELSHLVAMIQSEAGKSVDPYDYITSYITGIMLMLLTGEHVKDGDPLIKLCGEMSEDADMLCDAKVAGLLTLIPILGFIPLGYGKIFQRFKANCSLLKKTIYETRKTSERKKKCFLDFMLEEQKAGRVSAENVNEVFLDILLAGLSLTRSTIYSLLLILASRPAIQQKIQNEIDTEIGRSRLPRAEDKHRMSYTQAVLWEVFRYAPAAPLTLPHCTMEDVKIRNYHLPKDIKLFYNIWNVLHDETFWNNPWDFDPTRFLDDNGDLVSPEDEKRRRMIAFGVGKRLCLGEVLARLRVFMACVTILQNYTLLPDPQCPLPDTDPRTFDVPLFLSPPRYNIIFKPRLA